MYPYDQPMGSPQPAGSAAQYGLQVIPNVITQLVQQGQITQQEAYTLNQNLMQPATQRSLVDRLNTTYGYNQVNAAVVYETVNRMVLNAVQNLRQYNTQVAMANSNPSMMYNNAAMMGSPYTTYQNSMQPPQAPIPGVGMPAPQPQTVSNPAPKMDIEISAGHDMELCEPAVISTMEGIDEQRKSFSIDGVQSLVNGYLVKCGQQIVSNINFTYKIPMISLTALVNQINSDGTRYGIVPSEYAHVNMVEWYLMQPFPFTPDVRPFQLMDRCRTLYKQFFASHKESKKSIIPTIQEINRTILSDGGQFGIQLEDFIVRQLNKYAPTVFHRLDSDNTIRVLSGFENFEDFETLLKSDASNLDHWKADKKHFSNALSKLIATVYQRLFNSNRTPYLDPNDPDDRQAFIAHPFIPYKFNGKPLFMTTVEERSSEGFQPVVERYMRDCPVIVMPQRTIFHDLTWARDVSAQKRTVISERTPTEQIFHKLLDEKYYSLMEIVNDDDMSCHVIGKSYNNFLILSKLG